MIRDEEIIREFQYSAKREAAFTQLVQKYQERLYWHCRKILIDHEDADDALQNTFLKVWKGLETFRSESGLYTWLYRIATNESLSLLKQKKKDQGNLSMEETISNLSESLHADSWFDGDEAERKLQQAIVTLPEKQRLVFQMKYYEEMKYDDIAEILNTSVGGLKASYHHAVKKIEKYMRDE